MEIEVRVDNEVVFNTKLLLYCMQTDAVKMM